MCGHKWQKRNDICICIRCGLTRTYDGKIIFDRRFPAQLNQEGKKKK